MTYLAGFNRRIAEALGLVGVPNPEIDVQVVGSSAYGAVSDLAVAAVAAASAAAGSLNVDLGEPVPQIVVDRSLVDQWCVRGYEPDGWTVPAVWDEFARDYRTGDGWIRFHTNAPHHRAAALAVLGHPPTSGSAARRIADWSAEELEAAVYQAGGCAVELRTAGQWRKHRQGRAVAAEPIVGWEYDELPALAWRPTRSARPLAGLKVLDLTRVIAGPVATRFLAGLGADVLRIDPPSWSDGVLEVDMTLGKRCAGLDLHTQVDREVFAGLVGEADVLVHGYRADALDKLGFGRSTLTSLNPRLTTVGLNAFGWTGPWRNRRGFDSLVQRSSGLAEVVDGHVVPMPYQILDHATGYLTAAATIQALRARLAGVGVRSARLSLARQAQLLLDANVTSSTVDRAVETFSTSIDGQLSESSHLGRVRRYRPPVEIAGSPMAWNVPAAGVRSAEPMFSSGY